jgi:hypothetical protein
MVAGVACRVLGQSPSGLYEWLHRPLSARELGDRELLETIRQIYVSSRGTYLVARRFRAEGPDRLWVTDITQQRSSRDDGGLLDYADVAVRVS